MIKRSDYDYVSYDIIFKDGTCREFRSVRCYITLSGYPYENYANLDTIKLYLKDNQPENLILDWINLLNDVVPGYTYNKEDSSISFKFINKLHLKWSYTVIRYLWEPVNPYSSKKQKDYLTIIDNALYLYKNYEIDALNAICIGHWEVEIANSNHGCFYSCINFSDIDANAFKELLLEKPIKEYQNLHEVLKSCSISTVSTSDFPNVETVVKHFKLRKRNQMLKIFVVGGVTHYANWIENSELVKTPEEADMLLFTGGEDVDPLLYKQNVGKYTYINKKRDIYESFIFKKFKNKMKLGICRGSQFLTVMSGGRLIQHVTGHSGTHMIQDLETGKKYPMTSTHHQMCYPHCTEHVLIAVADKNLSDTYWNGENERAKLPKSFRDVEIVYYPKTNSLGIQGHPEMFVNEMTDVKDYLNGLINKYLKKEDVSKKVEKTEQSSVKSFNIVS